MAKSRIRKAPVFIAAVSTIAILCLQAGCGNGEAKPEQTDDAPKEALAIDEVETWASVWGWVFVGWIAVDLLINWADFSSEIGEFIGDVEDS